VPELDDVPEWEPGTVTVLSTAGGHPHAIPISTARRAGPRRVVLALAASRYALERLRADPRCALTVLAAGNVACTIHGRASIVQEPMPVADTVVALAVEVDRIQEHGDRRLVVEGGIAWRWTDAAAAGRDAAIQEALGEL
jgi:hypothetical protein